MSLIDKYGKNYGMKGLLILKRDNARFWKFFDFFL